MSGRDMIAAERRRQIEVEGYSASHDHEHGVAQLVRAARCYEVPQSLPGVPDAWPWDDHSWKPKTIVRNLIRAGALYQAAWDVAPPLGIDSEVAGAGVVRCGKALDEILAFAHGNPRGRRP
jgi:hypothetical protein